MKRKPIFERLDIIVNPAVNLAAIKSYDEILRETLNILKEYDDVVERIWDGDLFFMNYDLKETTPLLKGITDRVEGGTIDLVVKMVNAVIFQTKLDPIFDIKQHFIGSEGTLGILFFDAKLRFAQPFFAKLKWTKHHDAGLFKRS